MDEPVEPTQVIRITCRPTDAQWLFQTDAMLRTKLARLICCLATETIPYHDHVRYGAQWTQLHRETHQAIQTMVQQSEVPPHERMTLLPITKRNQPCDVKAIFYQGHTMVAERYVALHLFRRVGDVPFAYTISVRDLDLFEQSFDWYYYQTHLTTYLDTDDGFTEAPPRWEIYRRHVHKATSTHPFFIQVQQRAAVHTVAKKRIVNEAITQYMALFSTIHVTPWMNVFLTHLQNMWHMNWQNGTCTMETFAFDPLLLKCYRIQGHALLCQAGPYRISLKLQWQTTPEWTVLVQRRP